MIAIECRPPIAAMSFHPRIAARKSSHAPTATPRDRACELLRRQSQSIEQHVDVMARRPPEEGERTSGGAERTGAQKKMGTTRLDNLKLGLGLYFCNLLEQIMLPYLI